METVALAAFEGAIESLDDLFAHVDGKMVEAEGQADAATTGRGC